MLTVDDMSSKEVLLLLLLLPEERMPSPFSSLDDDDDDDDGKGLLPTPNSIVLVSLNDDDCMCFRTSVACSNALHRRK